VKPKQNMKMIDTTIHQLTAAQVLAEVIQCFSEDTTRDVIIATAKGRGDQMVAQIRVELSRAKAEHKRAKRPFRHFGFTATNLDLVVAGQDGVKREHRLLSYRVTPLQAMKNYADRIDGVDA
jgi:hypothetical protein